MRIPIIYILCLITLIAACKRDKPIASQEESIAINGENAPILGIEVLQHPTEVDNRDYIEVNSGEPVQFIYTGLEKDKITWTYDGLPLGATNELSTVHTWMEPGIKEIKATRSDGEELIVYVMVKANETPNSEPTPEPGPITPNPEPKPNPIITNSDPKPVKTDSDGDGVLDEQDKCKDQWGLKIFNGCPDSDTDGIPNHLDKCPNIYGKSVDGCPEDVPPPSDRDGDGVPDSNDKCPDLKGQFNGCPDTDGDGIADKDDKCPNDKGTREYGGCPIKGPDPDFDKTGRAGFSNITCKGQKEVSGSASITIKPKKVIELSHVKVIANYTGKANIKLEGDGGAKTINMSRQLNENTSSEINFQHLSYIMQPGNTYTITISGADANFSLSDLSECNTSSGSNAEVEISYGGSGKVFYNLTYAY